MNARPLTAPPSVFTGAIDELLHRRMTDGGFPEIHGGDYRPDATAWSCLCLAAFQTHPETAGTARARLAGSQLANGSIPLSAAYPQAFWPTAIAVIALSGHPRHSDVWRRAVDFLLATSGRQFAKKADSPLGHDTTITGWSWIDQTHSWVEPTALAIRALTLSGQSAHDRVRSGIRLLVDRQLPDGGWNYGNTTVYGNTLNPMPAPTGTALWSLAGLVDRETVITSIDLLARRLPQLRTPLSLGWALLGLAAWDVDLRNVDALIADCLERRNRYGGYGTSQLAVLLTAAAALWAEK